MTKRHSRIDRNKPALPLSGDAYRIEKARREDRVVTEFTVSLDDLDWTPVDLSGVVDWEQAEQRARMTEDILRGGRNDAGTGRCKHGLLLDGAYCQTCLREWLARSPDGADAFAHFAWTAAQDSRPRPEHWNCRSTINPCWGDGTPLTEEEIELLRGQYHGSEIITDPADQRGITARRIN